MRSHAPRPAFPIGRVRAFRRLSVRNVIACVAFALFTITISASAQLDPRGVSLPPVLPEYATSSAKLLDVASVDFDWTDKSRDDRSVPVKIYYPRDSAGPFPLIVFSHGLGGSRENYQYIANEWAANGYVVVLPTHVGSDTSIIKDALGNVVGGGGRAAVTAHVMEILKKAANLENSIARPRDVHFVIDQMIALNEGTIESELKNRIDVKHIGMAGHSFGAQTTMLIAGQTIGGKALEGRLNKGGPLADDRVKAAIAMSEPVPANKSNLDELYRNVKIPTYFMTGTKDDSPIGETKADERRLPFDHTNASPTLLLTLTDGDHMIFGGRGADSNPERAEMVKQIRLSSTAFFDTYLKDDPTAKKWLTEEFAKELDKGGVVEQK